MDSLSLWLPFLTVVLASSVVSGMVGMLGGMLLLSAMGLWFPPSVLIPLHGCLQAVSNGTRVGLLWRSVSWPAVAWFCSGSVLGAGVGLLWLPACPGAALSLLTGAFCLAGVWLPMAVKRLGRNRRPGQVPGAPMSRAGTVALGGGTTFLSLLAGASGPIVDAFLLNGQTSKQTLMGTKAAFQLTNHVLKVAVYAAGGFTLARWGVYLLAAVPLIVAGNRLGQALMNRVPQRAFLWVLRALVTALAVLLMAKAGS